MTPESVTRRLVESNLLDPQKPQQIHYPLPPTPATKCPLVRVTQNLLAGANEIGQRVPRAPWTLQGYYVTSIHPHSFAYRFIGHVPPRTRGHVTSGPREMT
ncbi:hypothetical protein HNY73_020090 [Argiope bruennichi]|uniref:Uncharacterized protein n=1 Tax=Argiope bruennichi TaxID=94029 RepID=A0A8T0E6I2_ARGBR|nr:hypothetical protein HNY73_020090 [Argiope bruennichi]